MSMKVLCHCWFLNNFRYKKEEREGGGGGGAGGNLIPVKSEFDLQQITTREEQYLQCQRFFFTIL